MPFDCCARMKHAAVWSIKATNVNRLGPTNFMAWVEASVAIKNTIRVPVTCKATSIACRFRKREKNGATKVTELNPIANVKLASKVLLFRKPVRGT